MKCIKMNYNITGILRCTWQDLGTGGRIKGGLRSMVSLASLLVFHLPSFQHPTTILPILFLSTRFISRHDANVDWTLYAMVKVIVL